MFYFLVLEDHDEIHNWHCRTQWQTYQVSAERTPDPKDLMQVLIVYGLVENEAIAKPKICNVCSPIKKKLQTNFYTF